MDENLMPGAEQDQTAENTTPEQTQEQTPEQVPAQTQDDKPALSWQAETSPELTADSSALQANPPKKKPIGIFVVIAVLVVAIIAVVASFLLADKPEDAVRKAQEKTNVMLTDRAAKMVAELPALAEMGKTPTSQKTNFSWTLEGLQGGAGDMSMQMISSMLKGLGIKGDFAIDGEKNIMELDAKIGLGDIELLNGYIYFSPEQMAFGVPKFSETMFSIVPATFKDDFLASEIYAEMLTAYEEIPEYKEMFEAQMLAQLTTLQEAFSTQEQMFAALDTTKIDSTALQEELTKRMSGIYEGAVYAKAPKENGLKVYTVQLQGAAVKKTVSSFVRYIYLESPLLDAYDTMFTAEMLDGMTYKEMMETNVVLPIEENMPEMPVLMTVKVDKKGIIRSMILTADPTTINVAEETMKLDKAIVDYSLDEKNNITCKIDVQGTDLTEPFGVTMDFTEFYVDGVADDKATVIMNLGENGNVTANLAMKMDQQGKCDVTMDFGSVSNAYAVKIDLAAGGGVKLDGDKTIWEYPAIDLAFNEGNDLNTLHKLGGVTFGWKSESSPLGEGYAPARTFTPIASMTLAEVEAEMDKYSVAVEDFIDQLSSLVGY